MVAFSRKVSSAAPHLVPANGENVKKLEAWIDALQVESVTNYVDALNTAMLMLAQKRAGRNCWSSYCVSALLFLTDGKRTCEKGGQRIQNLAENPQKIIFSGVLFAGKSIHFLKM